MSFSETIFICLFCFGGGYVLGHLTRNLRSWKLFLLMIMGAYLYVMSHELSQVQIVAVLAGMVSHHAGRLFSALAWAGSLGDMIFAFRYRSAFEDIKRRERELNEREDRLREEERRRAYADQERGERAGWQKEAGGFRSKAKAEGKSDRKEAPRGKAPSGESGRRQHEQKERKTERHSPPPQNGVRERHLQVLGLEAGREYTQAEIKKAYRKAAMKTHPDTGGSDEAFIVVQRAYEFLRRNER